MKNDKQLSPYYHYCYHYDYYFYHLPASTTQNKDPCCAEHSTNALGENKQMHVDLPEFSYCDNVRARNINLQVPLAKPGMAIVCRQAL